MITSRTVYTRRGDKLLSSVSAWRLRGPPPVIARPRRAGEPALMIRAVPLREGLGIRTYNVLPAVLRRKPDLLIPFNRPVLAGKELDYIQEAFHNGQTAGDGQFTVRCQEWLREQIGAQAVLLTHSCTAALELAAILIGIREGDEVIMPSFTFASTANAVVLRGGVPVFVDIRPDTLNIHEGQMEEALSSRTKAIFPVHYAGVPAEMNAVNQLAEQRGLRVVEDAAQALGSTYCGRAAGSLGHLAAISFHETKNIISGKGGALIINSTEHVQLATIIRNNGTNRQDFLSGNTDRYTWVTMGSSYSLGELMASCLYGQLEQYDHIQAARMLVWRAYDEAMSPFRTRGLRTPGVPPHCGHNAHMYFILLPSSGIRDELIERMRSDGITTPFHYVPLHSSPGGLQFGRAVGELPNTVDLSSRLVRLPLFLGVHIDRVLECLQTHLDELL